MKMKRLRRKVIRRNRKKKSPMKRMSKSCKNLWNLKWMMENRDQKEMSMIIRVMMMKVEQYYRQHYF